MNYESYESCDDENFKLKVTKTVWDCMCSCLDPNIFIVQLSHRLMILFRILTIRIINIQIIYNWCVIFQIF